MTEKEILSAIYEGMQEMKHDVKELKEDVSVLKEDVGVLKEDVSVLKEEVGDLKEDVSVLKEDVILSILVYTFFSRIFDPMLPPVTRHSIAFV